MTIKVRKLKFQFYEFQFWSIIKLT